MIGPDRDRLRWARRLAAAALLWERLWGTFWPALLVAGAFVAAALFDALPALPGAVHSALLLGFAVALAFAIRRGVRGFRLVTRRAVLARLERDNALRHRPLTAIDDRLAAGADSPAAVRLWEIHVRRMTEAARRLRVRPPSPGLAARDPMALRAVVLVILAAAVAGAVADPWSRLGRAFQPRFASAADVAVGIEAWITPPAYTRVAPMFLDRLAKSGAEPIRVPTGSAVLAQLTGLVAGDEAPRLKFGSDEVAFAPLGSGERIANHRVEAVVTGGDALVVRHRGRDLAAWPIAVVPDLIPTIAFADKPAATSRAHLRLAYAASDDYGLASVGAVIRRAEGGGVAQAAGGAGEFRLELSLPGLGSTTARGQQTHDLTPHPWAGLAVMIRLEATDGLGQVGTSEDVPLIMPERVFVHPVARAIIEQRKHLAMLATGIRNRVARSLGIIAGQPHAFSHDTVVFLALAVAESRLIHDRGEAAVDAVQHLLWNTALRIEDGELSVVDRELRLAEERLARALREGASPSEIDRLMEELRRALDRFMEALVEQLMRQSPSELAIPPNARSMGLNELQRMLDQAREMARTGSLEAAKRMLAELQRMLENLRAGIQTGAMRNNLAQTQQMMDQMRSLADRQQKLLDRTFRRTQRGERARPQPGERPERGEGQEPGEGEGEDADAAEQEAIRRELGEVMRKLGEMLGDIPDGLGKAERAMRESTGELRAGRPGGAIPPQTEALQQLRQGMESAMDQMARGMGMMLGLDPGNDQMPMGERGRMPNQDPFGRAPDGSFGMGTDDDLVKVPTHMEMRRAREILDELRKRMGERGRPRLERDYIQRLLKQF